MAAWLCDRGTHELKDASKKSTSNLRWGKSGIKPNGQPQWSAHCRACEAGVSMALAEQTLDVYG